VGDRVRTKLAWRTINWVTEEIAQLDELDKFIRLSDLSLVSARRNGGVTIWNHEHDEEPGPYLPGEAPEPCFICGDEEDHLGLPHGVATGDGKVRADVAQTTKGRGPCVDGGQCPAGQCLFGCMRAADELSRLGQEMAPEPVPDIDLGLCARIIELEADLKRAGQNALALDQACEELFAKLRKANTQLQNAVRENQTLRAELAEEVRKHNNTIGVAAGWKVDTEELRAENDKLRAELRERKGHTSQFYVDMAAENVDMAEKLVHIEEALEDPWHAGDTIRSILES